MKITLRNVAASLLLFSSISTGLYAQTPITLTQVDFPLQSGTIVLRKARIPFAAPQVGANQTYDYGTAGTTPDTTSTQTFSPSPYAAFPAPLLEQKPNSDAIVPGNNYTFSIIYGIDGQGLFIPGIFIPAQKYSTAAQTGGPNDSVFYPAQAIRYTPRYDVVRFPATTGSVWKNDYVRNVRFKLNAVALSADTIDGRRYYRFIRTDSVVGFGKITVPTANGPSIPYDVLQVQRKALQIDSFYLNGAPAPNTVLTALGTSQGKRTNNFRTLFYREGDFTPVFQINFGTNMFTTPIGGNFSGKVTAAGSGVNDVVSSNANLVLWMTNPVTTSQILMTFQSSEAGNTGIKLYNSLGALVASTTVSTQVGEVNATLPLGASVSNGIYLLQVANHAGIPMASRRVVISR